MKKNLTLFAMFSFFTGTSSTLIANNKSLMIVTSVEQENNRNYSAEIEENTNIIKENINKLYTQSKDMNSQQIKKINKDIKELKTKNIELLNAQEITSQQKKWKKAQEDNKLYRNEIEENTRIIKWYISQLVNNQKYILTLDEVKQTKKRITELIIINDNLAKKIESNNLGANRGVLNLDHVKKYFNMNY